MSIGRGILRAITSKSYRHRQIRKHLWPMVPRLYGNVAYVGIVNEGERILAFAKDREITRDLLTRGQYQKEDFHAAIAMLRAAGYPLGEWFLDVGANIGTQTIYALGSGAFSRALSIEPEPENFRILSANLLLNGFAEKVRTMAVAASDHDGTVPFELSADNFGDHRVVKMTQGVDYYGESRRAKVEVQCARLDDLMVAAGVAPSAVSMVWVDTQGHEGFVLAGASQLLKSEAPFVIEFWPYGLRRSGGLELLLDALPRHFNYFYDLAEGRAATRRSIACLGDVLMQLSLPDYHTDLLLVK